MAGEASFRNHMDMISLNEPVTRKAKFWQSYVRALKGTDDMRADDSTYKRPASRALSEFPDFFGSGHGEPSARIFAPGYRYLPVSRETYGYSPRKLYGHETPARYVPRAASEPELDLPEWLTQNPDYFYPSKYPLSYYQPQLTSSPAGSSIQKHGVPHSIEPYRRMLNPSPNAPISSVTSEPWWYGEGIKPAELIPAHMLKYPSALRNSYLSPVKNNYLWTVHPLRNI